MQSQKISRLFGILGQLSPHSQITIADLAREYEVSERTIERDLQVLQSSSLGVFSEEGKVRMSRNGYKCISGWIVEM